MEKILLQVEGMSCGHCVKAVEDAVNALDGVAAVEVSLENKTATVSYDGAKATIDQMKDAIEDEGYDVTVNQ